MPETSKNLIGARLKTARGTVTQQELSNLLAKAGVTIDRAGISKIEIGERSVYDFELKAISKVLKVEVDWLLGD